MNTDLLLYLTMVSFFIFGFIAGRWERKDAQTKTYRHGFHVGKQVGRNER